MSQKGADKTLLTQSKIGVSKIFGKPLSSGTLFKRIGNMKTIAQLTYLSCQPIPQWQYVKFWLAAILDIVVVKTIFLQIIGFALWMPPYDYL